MIKINDILLVHAGLAPRLLELGYSMKKVNNMIRRTIDSRNYTLRFDESLSFLFDSKGPVWYRGLVLGRENDPMASLAQVDLILIAYKVKNIVIGHTIVDNIKNLFNGRVFAIETGMHQGAEGEVLVWEGGHFFRSDIHGHREILK